MESNYWGGLIGVDLMEGSISKISRGLSFYYYLLCGFSGVELLRSIAWSRCTGVDLLE